jgi:hypothetical protein
MSQPATIKVWDDVYGYPIDCPCSTDPCDFTPEKTDMTGQDAGIENENISQIVDFLRQTGRI